MPNYIPLVVKTTYSLKRSTSKAWQIAQRLHAVNSPAAALMDDDASLACCVKYIKAMKDGCGSCGYPKNTHADSGKGRCVIKNIECSGYSGKALKTLLGSTFNLLDCSGFIHIIAKNLDGWKSLMKVSSASNHPTNYNVGKIAAINLSDLKSDNFVAFSGALGSYLGNACFTDVNAAYLAKDYATAKSFVLNWDELQVKLRNLAREAQSLFGAANFFLQIQLIDKDTVPANAVLANIMRWLSKDTGIKCVATPQAYYPNKSDAPDQRVLLCVEMDATLQSAANSVMTPAYAPLSKFFDSNSYNIPSYEEMGVFHTQEELENTLLVGELCEPYDIFRTPVFPKFQCPDGLTDEEYMVKLCREGWTKKIVGKIDKSLHSQYAERVKYELEVLKEAQLASYFLIELDVFEYARNVLKCKIQTRGSAEGSLALYLMNITSCDPIANGLMFERFYSAARNMPAHVNFAEFPFEKFEGVFSGQELRLIPDRVKKLAGNKFYQDELRLLSSKRVAAYYEAVLPQYSSGNSMNSYLAWASGKSDCIDMFSPAKITHAKASLPDIDADTEAGARESLIQYIRNKYGEENVANICTYGRMKGRESLTQVLRVHGYGSFEERKQITLAIPDEAAISDQLQEIFEEKGEASVIDWCLTHDADTFAEHCHYTPDGDLEGDLAPYFLQAIKLEETKKSQGKHAAGLIVSSVPIGEICPMVYDKSNDKMIVGLEFQDAESLGLVKFDFLGVSALSKIRGVTKTLASGVVG